MNDKTMIEYIDNIKQLREIDADAYKETLDKFITMLPERIQQKAINLLQTSMRTLRDYDRCLIMIQINLYRESKNRESQPAGAL